MTTGAAALAALCVGAYGASADDNVPPPHVDCSCGAWVNGYPPNSQWTWFPRGPNSADPQGTIVIRSWRAYRVGAARWESLAMHVCTSRSQGPFVAVLNETVGVTDPSRSRTAATRFALHRSRAPVGSASCRDVQYRWRPNPGVQTRGEHQLVVYVEYPSDAPPPVAFAFGRPFTLVAETTSYRG